MDSRAEAEGVAAVVEAQAKLAAYKETEKRLAAERRAEAEAREEARRVAAAKAVVDARAAEMKAVEDGVAEAQKQVRNVQKKLRLALELQEQHASGKVRLQRGVRGSDAAVCRC